MAVQKELMDCYALIAKLGRGVVYYGRWGLSSPHVALRSCVAAATPYQLLHLHGHAERSCGCHGSWTCAIVLLALPRAQALSWSVNPSRPASRLVSLFHAAPAVPACSGAPPTGRGQKSWDARWPSYCSAPPGQVCLSLSYLALRLCHNSFCKDAPAPMCLGASP